MFLLLLLIDAYLINAKVKWQPKSEQSQLESNKIFFARLWTEDSRFEVKRVYWERKSYAFRRVILKFTKKVTYNVRKLNNQKGCQIIFKNQVLYKMVQ